MAKKKRATDPKSTLPGNMTEAEARKQTRIKIANLEKDKRDALKEQKKLKQYNDMVANLADTDPSVKRELTRRAQQEGLTLDDYMVRRRREEEEQGMFAATSGRFADLSREGAAKYQREKRDERLANARRLRAQGRRRAEAVSASDLAISEARGDEAGRVGIERVRAAQSASTKGVDQPIDAVVDAAGVVSTNNLKDNQVIRKPDGSHLKYNTEDGSLTPVEFNAESDRWEVIKTPEPVRTGVQKLESLIPSQLDAARKFAEENADQELMGEYRRVQAQLDAINGDPTLTQEERDNAIRGLQSDARALFDRVSSQTLTQNEQAQEAARQKAFADQQEAQRAAQVRIQEALAVARSSSSEKRGTRTSERAEQKQAQLSNYRSQFDSQVEDAKSQLSDMRESAKEAGLSLSEYAAQEGMSSQQLQDLQMLASGSEDQFKSFFGKQLDDDNIKDSYDEQIFDKMLENEEAFAELNILQDLISPERAETFIKAIAGTEDASGNTIDREQAAAIWIQTTEETMNGVARLESEINRRKQEVLELKRRGTIVYTSPEGTPISYEEHQRAQQQARAQGVRPVGVQEARLVAAGIGGINPDQGTGNTDTGRARRTLTSFPDLPLGMAARELMQDEKLLEMNPVEFGQVAASELPGGAQVVYRKFMEDPSKYMDPEEYTEYVQMDDAQKHRAAMHWMKTNIDRTRRSILMNEEAREQMEKDTRRRNTKTGELRK